MTVRGIARWRIWPVTARRIVITIPDDVACTTFYAEAGPDVITAEARPGTIYADARPDVMVARCWKGEDMGRHKYVLKAESDYEILAIDWEDYFDPDVEEITDVNISVLPVDSLDVAVVDNVAALTRIYVTNGIQGSGSTVDVQLVLDSGRKTTEYIDIFTA